MKLSVIAAMALTALITAAPAHASYIGFTKKPNGEIINLTEANSKACERSPTFGRVVIKNGQHKLVLNTRDICERSSWRSAGRVPGLYASTWTFDSLLDGSGIGLSIDNSRNTNGEYRVVVRTKDRRATGWITIAVHRTQHVIEKRIYEGTDAFVNYCINREQEIRSHNGRLFCWRLKDWETVRRSFVFHYRRWR